MDTHAAVVRMVEVINLISLPFLGGTVIIGLIIALFQTLTQVQEQTLPHAIKIIFVAIVSLMSMGAIGEIMSGFMSDVFDTVARL